MYTWISENQIMDLLYDPDNYCINLIADSKYILQFYLDHGYLDDQEIDVFWKVTKINMEAKKQMLSDILNISLKMTAEHKVQFLQRIAQDEINEIDFPVIEFIEEIGASKSSNAEHTFIASRLMFKLIFNKDLNPIMYDKALTVFQNLIKNLEYEKIKPVAYDCIAHLKINKASVDTFKILRMIMETCFDSEKSIESSGEGDID